MSAAPDSPRLFVAVELPPAVLAALADVQEALRARGLKRLRWVRPEGIHLTLKFIGETPASRVTAIAGALAQGAAGHSPHSLALGALGTFGGKSAPRVLWVDVSGEIDRTRALQASLDSALVAAGFPPEGRPFAPHLTLARVPQESAREVAAELREAVRAVTPPPGTVRVQEVSLMQSVLGPGGARYRRLDSFPLAG